MGIVTTSSETAFKFSPEVIYDFVTNPANWTKTYPGSNYIGNLDVLPLKIGDTWEEGGEDGDKIFTWHLALAARPKLWTFSSVGRLGPSPRRDRRDGRPNHGAIPLHSTRTGLHAIHADDDDRSAEGCADARRLLPDRQSRQHRPLPCRHRQGTGIGSCHRLARSGHVCCTRQ